MEVTVAVPSDDLVNGCGVYRDLDRIVRILGEIVKFYFKVPEKAKKGTVYPIGIYYMPPTDERSDMFIGTDGDKSREKYAFQNWTGGSITVK